MREKTVSVAIAAALASVSSVSIAAETGFVGSAGLQYKQLKMDQKIKGAQAAGSGLNNGEVKASMPVLNLQLVGFYDDFSVLLKYETALQEDAADATVPHTRGNTSLDTDVDRNDYSISLGYRVNDLLSVFGGYMDGKTVLAPNACVGCNNTASLMKDDGFGKYEQEYRESGFFIGASSGLAIGDGRLSGSLAYAFMDGIYEDNYRDRDGADKFKFEGDSKGLSASVTWLAPINESLLYFVDARMQRYSMDADDKSAKYSGIKVETDETILGLTAGVQLQF